MNLKEANLYDYPIWQKLYSTRAAYNMPSLRPEDWDVFTNNLAEDQAAFDLYYKYNRKIIITNARREGRVEVKAENGLCKHYSYYVASGQLFSKKKNIIFKLKKFYFLHYGGLIERLLQYVLSS